MADIPCSHPVGGSTIIKAFVSSFKMVGIALPAEIAHIISRLRTSRILADMCPPRAAGFTYNFGVLLDTCATIDNEKSSFIQLGAKTIVLMLLASGRQCVDIHRIQLENRMMTKQYHCLHWTDKNSVPQKQKSVDDAI